MEKWVVTAKKADFQSIGKKYGIDPVIARLIRNRDVVEDEDIRRYLYGTVKELPSPWLLKDMKKTVDCIFEKIRENKKIRILGDYDIDGVTSTYILLKGLKRLGARVDTYIPDRIADGYGIHLHLIEKALEDGIDTVITCDNGIAASEEIAYAKKKGMTLLVTDHHEIPFREEKGKKIWMLPPADAIINPKQQDCPYPQKNLCGGAVAFKLVSALYEAGRVPMEELEDFYEFVAIATVGDVMDLQGENRVLVKEGLNRLSHTKNPGLRALIQANGLEDSKITAYHVGFVLGPCINASGRLDTASRSLKLLCADSYDEAKRLAGDLTALNVSRKALTEQGKEQAFSLIDTTSLREDPVLVVYLPDCHESLAGIIAGRIREKYHKPAFVLTDGASCVKGSGRSIEAYSMYEELVKCADLLEQFGGHPMAAGFSLKKENVETLRKRLNENCTLKKEDFIPKIVIDVPMPVSYISKNLVKQISLLEPFGKGNTRPLFAQKGLRVLSGRILGRNQNVAKVTLMDSSGFTIDGIYFGEAREFLDYAEGKASVSVTYYPEINCYQGREKMQAVIQNYC
ncbi:MAG: single-stranded-DNA-specific exonuclease RecJ [Blautia sp.]|nr:single-stranded-DNA-specific exonuclease RecJ [Blautia sp.]